MGWFFGRSREFVDEQTARYGDSDVAMAAGSCEGDAEWWAETYSRIMITEYRAFTLPNLLAGGLVIEHMLDEYASAFATLHLQQRNSDPPPATIDLQEEFLGALSLYELGSSNLVLVASGTLDPLAKSAYFANGLEALSDAKTRLESLRGASNTFVARCQPVVVFVPTLGGDTPPAPGLPGEPEPEGYFPVGCDRFTTRLEALRFYEAAGAGDPHGLDRAGDGIACEPGE